MIKVMVVIYGLVMLVPQGAEVANCSDQKCRAETLTAILLESDTHQPMIRWVDGNGGLEPPWDLPEATESDFQVTVTAPGTLLDLDDWTWFPRIHELATTRMTRGCLTPDGSCSDLGKDLTHGMITFSGGWGVSPATYCHGFQLPIGYHDKANMKFPRFNGDDRDRYGERKIGTAIVLTRTLESEAEWADLRVELGGVSQKPDQRLEKEVCRKWMGEGVESCAILILGNRPQKPMKCSGHEDCRHDRHFADFYLLTTEPGSQSDRRIPYVTGSARCPTPDIDSNDLALYEMSAWLDLFMEPRNMPSVRCPPAFVLSEPDALTQKE